MAYGEDKPRGLIPKSSLLGAQSIQNLASKIGITAYIKSGYENNIGIGDPVIMGVEGYIKSAYDACDTGTRLSMVNIYGVFAGCKIPQQTNNANSPYPILPGIQKAWYANTATQGSLPSEASIIPATYQGVFSIQTDASGCNLAALSMTAGAYNAPGAGFGQFVFQATGGVVDLSPGGQSTGYLSCNGGAGFPYSTDRLQVAAAACTFQIVGFDQSFSLGNTSTARTQIGLRYGNVLVRIAATQFPSPTLVA